MTLPQKTFREAKVKGYVHWPVEKWMHIQNQAKELNIPNHWVVTDLLDFILQDKGRQLEFRNYLKDKYPGKVVQKGTSISTSDRALGIIRCPRCGLQGTKIGLVHHLCQLERQSHPMDQLIEVEMD